MRWTTEASGCKPAYGYVMWDTTHTSYDWRSWSLSAASLGSGKSFLRKANPTPAPLPKRKPPRRKRMWHIGKLTESTTASGPTWRVDLDCNTGFPVTVAIYLPGFLSASEVKRLVHAMIDGLNISDSAITEQEQIQLSKSSPSL